MTDISSGYDYTKRAGFVVSVLSGGFVAILLLFMFYAAFLQSRMNQGMDVTALLSTCDGSGECVGFGLESEVQRYKAARMSLALLYRFSLSAAAIIVSLVMVVLGSVLIFDRVYSDRHSSVSIDGSGAAKGKLSINSAWPGLVLSFLGAVCLCLSAALAGRWAPPISIVDAPVFVEDSNWWRNRVDGGGSRTEIGLADATDSSIPPERWASADLGAAIAALSPDNSVGPQEQTK